MLIWSCKAGCAHLCRWDAALYITSIITTINIIIITTIIIIIIIIITIYEGG